MLQLSRHTNTGSDNQIRKSNDLVVHLKRVALLGFLMGLGILSIAQAATVTWTVDTLAYTDYQL
ncbi:MAG: hypothetical protein HWN51_07460 [Desulfobacterales bacterium]|nr:hypothetical protein [Desulfobacterales bacterium]